MSDELTLQDLQSKFINYDGSLAELQAAVKDMQTAGNADAVMPVDYDPEIKKTIQKQTAFTEWLKAEQIWKGTDKVKVGYKLKTGKTKSNWMNETDEIAKATAADFGKKYAYMKICHYPTSIGDLAEKGADFDLMNDELNDGYIDLANNVDKTLLEGEGTEESKDFKGIFNLINTNTVKLGGNLLTKDDLTSLFQGIIDEGGFPTGLVCTAEVADQINDLYYPGTVKELTTELTAGFNVTGIVTTAGNTIPIIVNSHIDNSNGEKLAVIDSSSFKVRELLPPSPVLWPKTKLALDQSIIHILTSYMDSEYKNAMITGIAKDTDRPTLTRTGNVAFQLIGTDGKPVSGAKIKFADTKNTYISTTSNNRGLAEIGQAVYGTYTVTVETVPSGYTALSTYADFEINANESSVQLVLTKN